MKDEDPFSKNKPPPTTSDQERGGDSDRRALSPAYTVSGQAPPAHAPKTERRLPPRHHVRLLLVVMVVVVLVALAGGYSVFRALSPPPPLPTYASRAGGLLEGNMAPSLAFIAAFVSRTHWGTNAFIN
jgi:hypothetical protein